MSFLTRHRQSGNWCGGSQLNLDLLLLVGPVLAAALALLVCGSSGPSVQFVEGSVLVDGRPLDGAEVSFSPLESGVGLAAVGRTDAGGRFTLNPQVGKPGAGTLVGSYRVTIRKRKPDEAAEEALSTDDPNYGKRRPIPQGSGPPKWLVPVEYTANETTPLRADVQKGRNTFRFEIQ